VRSFSNRYIVLYAAALVAVAALLLTVVSVSLQPRQQHNRQLETQRMILKAAGIDATPADAGRLYAAHIREVRLLEQDSLTAWMYGTSCILPVRGNGLWGPIWGYICFDRDWTVTGAVFDHQGETPGLGGEIATEAFARRFIGKSCTDTSYTRFVPIVLTKHADPASRHEVDAISGGTMTSNGVTAMLRDCLSKYQDCMLHER